MQYTHLVSELLGMFSADKNNNHDHDPKWFEAYIAGIIANCGSYLLATRDQTHKVSIVKARTE